MAERRFTEAEALALVGKRIRNTRKWGYVPKGTPGVVTRAEPIWVGGQWLLNIQWDLPDRMEPLSDWVGGSEYGRWVKEQ